MLPCVPVYCSVLQLLQCVGAWSMQQVVECVFLCVAACCSILQFDQFLQCAGAWSTQQVADCVFLCVAACCSVVQCAYVCCRVLGRGYCN